MSPRVWPSCQAAPQLAKEHAGPLLDLIDQKGQEHQQGKRRRQALLRVPVVMLEMVALVL